MSLTKRGSAAWPHFRDGFDGLHTGARILRNSGQRKTITVSVSPAFGSCWLLPRIRTFRAAHPDISIRIDASEEIVDFARDEVDLAIRQGRGSYKGLRSELLLRDVALLVCAPNLVGGVPLRLPHELAAKTLIHVDWQLSSDAAPTWERWVDYHHLSNLVVTDGLRFSQEDLAARAAIAGMGVALITMAFVTDDLAGGRLIRALPECYDMPTAFHHFLVYPPERIENDGTLRTFRNWLLAQAGSASTPSRGPLPVGVFS